MNIVTKAARRATRDVSGGEIHLGKLKTQGHRKARRHMKYVTRMVTSGGFDADAINFNPNFTVDSRDVS
jgi:hypothetical protein